MKVSTIKLKKRRLFAAVGLASALICLILCLVFIPHPESAQTVAGGDPAQQSEHIAFLKGYGWETEAEPCEIAEVTIPEQFDDVYKEYNRVQKAQGMDLSKYRGKTVKRWTYVVTNYPGYSGEVRANLLCYEDKIIGGDICSTALGGFLHGFSL